MSEARMAVGTKEGLGVQQRIRWRSTPQWRSRTRPVLLRRSLRNLEDSALCVGGALMAFWRSLALDPWHGLGLEPPSPSNET